MPIPVRYHTDVVSTFPTKAQPVNASTAFPGVMLKTLCGQPVEELPWKCLRTGRSERVQIARTCLNSQYNA